MKTLIGKVFNVNGKIGYDGYNPLLVGVIIEERLCKSWSWSCSSKKCYRKLITVIYPDFEIIKFNCALKEFVEEFVETNYDNII